MSLYTYLLHLVSKIPLYNFKVTFARLNNHFPTRLAAMFIFEVFLEPDVFANNVLEGLNAHQY